MNNTPVNNACGGPSTQTWAQAFGEGWQVALREGEHDKDLEGESPGHSDVYLPQQNQTREVHANITHQSQAHWCTPALIRD